MNERRTGQRDRTETFGVRAETTLADGSMVAGVVVDVNEGGAGIAGGCDEVRNEAEVEVVFVYVSGERVLHRCVVCHVDASRDIFGVRFVGDPIPIKVDRQDSGEDVGQVSWE